MHECFLDVNGKPALRVLPITSARHATSANTDNIVYKLVTFFAVYSYSISCFCQDLNPDTLIGRKFVPAPGVMNYLRGHCTAKLHQCLRSCSCIGTRYRSHLSLYREAHKTKLYLYLEAKNAPCFSPFGL
jgi:hypothetical protein